MRTPPDGTRNLPLEIALLGVLAFLWGAAYPMTKVAVATIPPISLSALRVTVAGVILLGIMWAQGARLPADRKTWGQFVGQACLTSIAPWTMIAWGQQYVDSALVGVLNSTSPIFVFFITLLITRHERLSALKLAGALLGAAGVALIVGVDALHGLGREVAAQLVVLFAALLYGFAAIHGRRFVHLSPTVTAAGTMLCAIAFLVPMSLALERPWTLTPSVASLLSAMALAIFSTSLALLLYFRLVRTLGSMGVASQAYLRAGISVLLGVVVLGERISPIVGVGVLVAILGVAAINMPPRRRMAGG